MKLKEILDAYQRGDFMSLALKEKRAVVNEVSKRCKKTKKKEKKNDTVLTNFVPLVPGTKRTFLLLRCACNCFCILPWIG